MRNLKNLFISLFVLTLASFNTNKKSVIIVRFKGVQDSVICGVIKYIKAVYGYDTYVVSGIKMLYHRKDGTYDGDKLCDYLYRVYHHRVIGVTTKPLSVSTDSIRIDVFGCADMIGKSAMISSYSVDKDKEVNEMGILAIHELGHTFGLPDCNESGCFMEEGDGSTECIDSSFYFGKECSHKLKHLYEAKRIYR